MLAVNGANLLGSIFYFNFTSWVYPFFSKSEIDATSNILITLILLGGGGAE